MECGFCIARVGLCTASVEAVGAAGRVSLVMILVHVCLSGSVVLNVCTTARIGVLVESPGSMCDYSLKRHAQTRVKLNPG